MLFYLFWILVSAKSVISGVEKGSCQICGGSHSGGGGYPSWFPNAGYDQGNQGYSPGSQYPTGYDKGSTGYYPPSSSGYPSGYDKGSTGTGYWVPSSSGYPNSYDKGSSGYPGSYDKGSSGYYPPSSSGYPNSGYQPHTNHGYPTVADKGYQGYPMNKGQNPNMYDTGYNGYHQGWYQKGSGQYPSDHGRRIDYIDDDRSDVYARRSYKGDPGYSGYRVKKESTATKDEKTTST